MNSKKSFVVDFESLLDSKKLEIVLCRDSWCNGNKYNSKLSAPVSSIKKTERLYSSVFYIKSFLFSTFLKFLLLKFLLHSFLFPHFDIISFQVCKKYHRFIISLVISFCYISFTPKSLTLFWLRHCAPVVFIHLFLCCNIIGNNKKKGECNNEII